MTDDDSDNQPRWPAGPDDPDNSGSNPEDEVASDHGSRDSQGPEPPSSTGHERDPSSLLATSGPSFPEAVLGMRDDSSRQPILLNLGGARVGKMTPLRADRLTLGRDRDAVDIWFPDSRVSKRHAALVRDGESSYSIRDLDSSTGTFVEGERVQGTRLLEPGDRIVLSERAILKYVMADTLDRSFHDTSYEPSVRDPLTDAHTRDHLEEQMRAEVDAVRRDGGSARAAFLLLDLDRFERVNDRHGETVGDAVLVAFSALCRSKLQPEDLYARYGGEAFGILRRLSTPGSMRDTGTRIREAVADRTFRVEGESIRLTVSIGAAVYASNDRPPAETQGEWLRRADRALSDAKAAGGNCLRLRPRSETPVP